MLGCGSFRRAGFGGGSVSWVSLFRVLDSGSVHLPFLNCGVSFGDFS